MRSSLGRDIKILKSFVSASDDGQQAVSGKDVAPFIDVSVQIVGGVLSFFAKIGFAVKEGFNYRPSQELVDFVKEMKFEEDEQKAGAKLKPLVLNTWFGEMAVKIFETENGPLSKEELFKRIGKLAGADADYHKPALNHVIDYLKFSDVIEFNEEGNIFTLTDKSKVTARKKEEGGTTKIYGVAGETGKDENIFEKMPVSTKKTVKVGSLDKGITINFNFNIDESFDIKKFQRIIQILNDPFKNEKEKQ